ncbi:hypothetical protein ABT255_17320 [Streptomyces mirabilis]|uniref:hypothetical protein n=1 Tax=Streptomyces mirabilis TaxID=68239 RepID=UPI002254AC19|nr:hypothetical protein [Streptomyces mirabilis]MCX4617958.1 hypothetical protein [Streptomyces mirabilis]
MSIVDTSIAALSAALSGAAAYGAFLIKESEEKVAEFEEQTKKLTRARGQRALPQRQS